MHTVFTIIQLFDDKAHCTELENQTMYEVPHFCMNSQNGYSTHLFIHLLASRWHYYVLCFRCVRSLDSLLLSISFSYLFCCRPAGDRLRYLIREIHCPEQPWTDETTPLLYMSECVDLHLQLACVLCEKAFVLVFPCAWLTWRQVVVWFCAYAALEMPLFQQSLWS